MGDLVTDVVVVPTGAPAPGSDTTGVVRFTGGGQGANTACWLVAAGHPALLITAVGSDDAGRARVAELTAAGVRCAVREHPGAATGAVVVLAAGAERTLINDSGAALLLDAGHVTAAVAAEPDPGHLHLSGYCLLHPGPQPAALAALAAARARGCTTSVDASSAALLRQAGPAAFLGWAEGTDLLLANADEAAALAGPGPAGRQAAALTRVARHVVVKQGAAGAVWHSADGTSARVTPDAVRVVDPTGAGDAFAAGLLAAWCTGAAPQAALAAGAALGARAVGRVGARPGRDPGPRPG